MATATITLTLENEVREHVIKLQAEAKNEFEKQVFIKKYLF